jgi:hypothetical protein
MSGQSDIEEIILAETQTQQVSGPIPDDNDIDSDGIGEQKLKREKQKLLNNLLKDDISIRKNLSYWAAIVVSLWLLCVLAVLILSGTSCLKLSDVVLSTLLATTTLNVLGLMFIVLKGYFAAPNQRS